MSVLVTANRFNLLKNRIHTILGPSLSGNPQFGYGQSVFSSGVVGNYNVNTTSTNLIDDQEYRNLYIDLVRARVHQIGSAAFTQQPFITGDFDLNGASTDKVRETYIAGLESLMTQIEADKFNVFESEQATLDLLRNSAGFAVQGSRLESSAGSWNRTLSFIFTVTFATAEARRHFFNAGGQIRMSGSRVATASSNTKSTDWSSLITSVGQVVFAANRTISLNSFGASSSIGNYGLTSAYQLCYRGASSSYTGNAFEVYALQLNATQIQFRVYFADTRSEGTDEPVFGNFFVNTNILLPDGSVTIGGTNYNTVEITTPPVGAIVTNLTQI